MARHTKAVDEGVDAFCAGLSRNACPYDLGTAEHLDWKRGWDEAEVADFEESAEADLAEGDVLLAKKKRRDD